MQLLSDDSLPSDNPVALFPLEVNNPLTEGNEVIYLMEPPDAPLGEICRRLVDGSYKRPYIVDDGESRSLHFDLRYVQSSMHMDDPTRLRLRYTQKMMGFLLFGETPRQITVIGLGGGSLAKYCYRQLPNADITVVEIDPYVVALREHFMVPADDVRFRIEVDDGLHHLAVCSTEIDVLLVDAYDSKGVARSIASAAFILHAFHRLGPNGIFIMNLTGSLDRYEQLILRVKKRFNRHVLVIPVGADGNSILYAFKDAELVPDWSAIRICARAMNKSTAMDYFFMAQLLEHSWKGIEPNTRN